LAFYIVEAIVPDLAEPTIIHNYSKPSTKLAQTFTGFFPVFIKTPLFLVLRSGKSL